MSRNLLTIFVPPVPKMFNNVDKKYDLDNDIKEVPQSPNTCPGNSNIPGFAYNITC